MLLAASRSRLCGLSGTRIQITFPEFVYLTGHPLFKAIRPHCGNFQTKSLICLLEI